MKINWCLLLLIGLPVLTQAQYTNTSFTPNSYLNKQEDYSASPVLPKLYQRNIGAIVGLQRGRSTFIELGGEAHWRKIGLKKPYIYGATANLEYNFGHHIIGYKAGMWMKHGRVNLTYGGNISYYTDFNDNNQFGIGPAVGFRLLGFHFINGYNFLIGDKEVKGPNTLYVTLRYYFPIDNKFTWDKKNNDRQKAKRKKVRAKQKRQKENDKNKDEKKLLDIFRKN